MISFMVRQKNCRKTVVRCAAVFFCPKFCTAGKKYLVFAGLRWEMIELYLWYKFILN